MSAALDAVRDAIRARQTFLLTSHARPDGDSIGSQLAMAFALDALGKRVRIVNADPPPAHYAGFPGLDRIEVAPSVEAMLAEERSGAPGAPRATRPGGVQGSPPREFDALIVMECGDLGRPGVEGLAGRFTINIDHHVGNTGYGDLNWFDERAAACAELVADLIDALGVRMTREIGTYLYLGILTDTGGFHHGAMSARTFEISRRAVEAGVDAAAMARQVYDSSSIGKLRLIGMVLDRMQLEAGGRVAVLRLQPSMLEDTGSTVEDTEGLINLPLTAKEIEAVLMFKDAGRVSIRSKGPIDVRAIAAEYGGGGHVNAAGMTLANATDEEERTVIAKVVRAVEQSRG